MNTFGYVGANPLRFTDPYGLDYVDVNNILNDLAQRFSDLAVPNVLKYKPLESNDPYGADGQYDRLTGETWLPPEQRCKNLSIEDFISLYQTLYHEIRHAYQGPFEYRYDFIYEKLTRQPGPSHSEIIRDTGELVTGQPGMLGTSIVDQIEELYRDTRDRDSATYECVCN